MSVETDLKRWIAGFYFTDMRYSFKLIQAVRKSVERTVSKQHRDNLGSGLDQHKRARLLVELLMCCEFASKGLIFWFSKESESADDIYKLVRRFSHGVFRLAKEACDRANESNHGSILSAQDLATIKQASPFAVGVRYSLEAHLFFMQDVARHRKLGQGKYSEMIAAGLYDLYAVNKKFSNLVYDLWLKDRAVCEDPHGSSERLDEFARVHRHDLYQAIHL